MPGSQCLTSLWVRSLVRRAGPLKELGNDYVRSEFRSHLRNAKVTREQWQQFDQQWRNYLSFIGGTADAKAPIFDGSGELKPDVLEVMSEDQRKRVQQLKDAASKLGQPDG